MLNHQINMNVFMNVFMNVKSLLMFRKLSLLLLANLILCAAVQAAPVVGMVKTSNGQVKIHRAGGSIDAKVGTGIEQSDVINTGANSAVGITFIDNSRFSAGANSEIVVDQFSFDRSSHQGVFRTRVNKGTLSVISGKIVAHKPGAMTIKTPSSILGVRGTSFLIRVGE